VHVRCEWLNPHRLFAPTNVQARVRVRVVEQVVFDSEVSDDVTVGRAAYEQCVCIYIRKELTF
jgi:hypothetical protein